MEGFQIARLDKTDIERIAPLMHDLMDHSVEDAVLKERLKAMFDQNYECHGIFYNTNSNKNNNRLLIGIFGLWFATRHYSGKTCEPDHVFIEPEYRSKGLGKWIFEWIFAYSKEKGCSTSELNSYVSNYPSHKFYLNAGYEILGYHFLKKLWD